MPLVRLNGVNIHYDIAGDGPLLPRVKTPVLVLSGAEDVLTPPAQSQDMANLIPDAKLRICFVEDTAW
jgi:pimeloyl-ACP methyl ester carboxylesterase